MKGNYFLLPNCIYDDDLNPYQISVYGYLVRCADKSGRCYPSRETISKKCNIKSVVTVDKAIKELESRGYIDKTKRYDFSGRGNLSNIYTINKI